MRRRLSRLCTAGSTVLCVVSCVAWMISGTWGGSARWRTARSTHSGPPVKSVELRSSGGCLMLAVDTGKPRTPPTDPFVAFFDARNERLYLANPVFNVSRTDASPPYLASRFGFGWFPRLLLNSTGLEETRLIVPWWAVAFPSAVLPTLWLRRRRAAARRKPGHCPTCGYDLRATPDRCPECGRAGA